MYIANNRPRWKPQQLQYIQDFVRAIINGVLPSGAIMQTPTIPFNQFEAYWNYDSRNLPKGGPRPAPNTQSDFLNLNDKFFECVGSTTNRKAFRLFEKGLNGIKGRLFNIADNGNRVNPVSQALMEENIEGAIALGVHEENFLSPMRAVSSHLHGFSYIPFILFFIEKKVDT